MARPRRKKKLPDVETVVFLPDCLDQVKAIAKRGLSDSEMAAVFGIPKRLITKWKKFYPDFAKAIEDGRTDADARVIQALFERAIGYEHPEVKLFFDQKNGEVIEHHVTKRYPPDVRAITTWLTNRTKEWTDTKEHRVGGTEGAPPIGVRDESKEQIVASILNLIQPKPDGD